MFLKTNKIAREKSCDCVLIIHMKKYEIIMQNFDEMESSFTRFNKVGFNFGVESLE